MPMAENNERKGIKGKAKRTVLIIVDEIIMLRETKNKIIIL